MTLRTDKQLVADFGLPSVRTVRTMRQKGLPAVRLGKAYLYDPQDVSAFIAQRKVSACPAPNRGPYLKFLKHRGAFYIHWSESGRTRQRSTGTADSGEAEAALAELHPKSPKHQANRAL